MTLLIPTSNIPLRDERPESNGPFGCYLLIPVTNAFMTSPQFLRNDVHFIETVASPLCLQERTQFTFILNSDIKPNFYVQVEHTVYILNSNCILLCIHELHFMRTCESTIYVSCNYVSS